MRFCWTGVAHDFRPPAAPRSQSRVPGRACEASRGMTHALRERERERERGVSFLG